MDTIVARFTVNTPLFMSGAKQQQAELRAASTKGMIRFWWRALNYANYKTLDKLKEVEEQLFGSTSCQSTVRFILEQDVPLTPYERVDNQTNPVWLGQKAGLSYLAYGVVKYINNLKYSVLSRPCYPAGTTFSLKLITKEDTIDSSLTDAIKLFGLLGGMGARARKGYGSVTLLSLERTTNDRQEPLYIPDSNMSGVRNNLATLLGHTISFDMPANESFSAFSSSTRIDQLLKGNDPLAILDNYGTAMQLYRGWGFSGQSGTEKNFKNDHDWFKKDNNFRTKHKDFHPERALFGLPHNYFKYVKNGNNLSASVSPDGDYERRASPLFFHIHKFPDGTYHGISILFPAMFLPPDVKINADSNAVDVKEDNYQVIVNFLEGKKGLRNHKTKKLYFPKRKTIWPQQDEE